ncbi:MAG: cob(I)yrinic acid a,c-diamide adenosyltransferase [Syntrophobacteraceae bacterium]|nr:cob(I)yrinic acid a,c-diamide adenosyltransferase [Syntrophobacteraceae bacterium]
MKAYTGKGDQGTTNLYSGERVTKSHPRVEACGDLDELNSVLGALISVFPADRNDLKSQAEHIQSVLFVAGAWLSTTPDSERFTAADSVAQTETEALEQLMDRMDGELPRLKEFILPGGHFSGALAHVARTVCRRAERHVAALCEEASEGKAHRELMELLKFLNRLSSYLFVLARYLNRLYGVNEAGWKNPRSDSKSPG